MQTIIDTNKLKVNNNIHTYLILHNSTEKYIGGTIKEAGIPASE